MQTRTLTNMKKLIRMAMLWVALAFASVAHAADFPAAKILFESGKADVPAEAGAAIKAVSDYLAANPAAKAKVSGFVDATGSPEANKELAKKRAMAVQAELAAAGVANDRIVLQRPEDVTAGKGDEARRSRLCSPRLAHQRRPAAAASADAASAPAAAAAPVANKGDTAWMIVATLLVIMMTIPGLALFYGGLVRSKNMLSVLMQVMVTFSMIVVLWVIYGYSLAFTEGNAFFGGLDRLFMKGVFDPQPAPSRWRRPSARASTSPSCCSPRSRRPSPASPAA